MALSFTVELAAFLAVVVFVSGAINGIAGFGFALVGTMTLATIVEPAVAVVFMIVPILSVNVTLLRELSTDDLQSCGRQFGPLILSALVGTLLGLVLVDRIPAAPLRVALGVVSLAFVATAQNVVTVPGLGRAREGCFVETTPAMVGVGGLSGLLFGGTNVGVQLVAYVRSCDLSHGLFVGVVAMVFIGLNAIRVGAAGALGMYPDLLTAGASLAATLPAAAGVGLGVRFRERIGERTRNGAVLALLSIVGIRLVLGGLGIV